MLRFVRPYIGDCGEFRNIETGCYFTFRPTVDAWAISHGFTHEIDVLDGIRFAKVLKSVVKVAVNEDGDGMPVVESWKITNKRAYLN